MTPDIDRHHFENLLRWLHPEREKAGEKYESVRGRLVKIFGTRGCTLPEELADETIDRVARKAGELIGTYAGDPALYFYGVAKNVFLEHSRKPKTEELPPTLRAADPEGGEAGGMQECLDECLGELSRDNLELITRYYEGDKQLKIRNRKILTEKLGISATALRVRALRVRVTLQKCVEGCVRANADRNVSTDKRISI